MLQLRLAFDRVRQAMVFEQRPAVETLRADITDQGEAAAMVRLLVALEHRRGRERALAHVAVV